MNKDKIKKTFNSTIQHNNFNVCDIGFYMIKNFYIRINRSSNYFNQKTYAVNVLQETANSFLYRHDLSKTFSNLREAKNYSLSLKGKL
jgi:hypothetical protein